MCMAFVLTSSAALAAPNAQSQKPARGGGSGKVSEPLGLDVSWPQCGKQLPNDFAFAVVGVNGGLATIPNECLGDQLVWAQQAKSTTSQAPVQLYVNTANPAEIIPDINSWPLNNYDPVGRIAPNPFGECDGTDSLACQWQYGYNRAVEDVHFWFEPAATAAGVNAVASDYVWWLDVETENTWRLGGTPADYAGNVAVLEGMATYLDFIGADVGLYSTGHQWGLITGGAISEQSNLKGLPNWRPGGANVKTAKQACSADPLTSGGNVVLTQFISKNLDYNYACP